MTLRFEFILYQPPMGVESAIWLVQKELDDSIMQLGGSFDLGISTGISDDKRPLFMAARIIDGNIGAVFSEISFSFRFERFTKDSYGEIDERDSDTSAFDSLTIKTDPSSWSTGWTPYFVIFDKDASIEQVQAYWGPPVGPE